MYIRSILSSQPPRERQHGIVPGAQGMHAELMLNYEEVEEEGQINYRSAGKGVPHHYWTLDLPPLEPLQRLAEKYLPPTTCF